LELVKTILVVEDSLTDLKIVSLYLQEAGLEVVAAKSGEEVQEKLLVISSSKGTEVDKMWGNMLGADAYLPKPIDRDELLRTIRSLLRK